MSFEQPAWLLALLLVPLFVTGAILTARLRKRQWSAFVSNRLRGRLLRRGSTLPRWLAFSFLMLAYSLLAFALARPQTIRRTESQATRGRNVLFAIDLSRSMLAKDLKPDRLSQAKILCSELIDAMPNDRIGVVGFAGESYLFAPLTSDHPSVLETIDQLDTESIPVQGSNLASALSLSLETLKKTGQKENALILLTDGEETTKKMLDLASDAKKAGMYVFTIAFGTEQGDFVPDPKQNDGRHRDRSGKPITTRLEAGALKALASGTGGRFAVATSAADIPAMVTDAIKDLEQFEQEGRKREVPTEHYQWFLLPAVLSLMASVIAGTRWRALVPVAAAAVVFLVPAPAQAALDDQAKQFLKDGKADLAVEAFRQLAEEGKESPDSFRFRLGEGTAAYRNGNIDSARKAFSQALRSTDSAVKAAAHHGMGNVLFERGWRSLSEDTPYPGTSKPAESGGGIYQRILDALLDRDQEKPAPKEGETPDPLAPFDEMVAARMMEWFRENIEDGDGGASQGYERFDSVLTDWIDAVKHYDSATGYSSGLEDSKTNRALTIRYLKRLRDILEKVQENAQMMGSGAGQGEQEGEGDGGDGDQPGEGNGRGGQRGKGRDGEQDPKGGSGGQKPDDKERDGSGGRKPKKGETPEDTARRLLKENADFEKGAPTQGRATYRQPDKDW